MWSRFRLGWLTFWGRIANLAGLPAIVRAGDYHSRLGPSVRVRTSPLFTTVTVNGVDVYFYRLTGKIDGVGFSPSSDYSADAAQQSERSVLQSETPQPPARR